MEAVQSEELEQTFLDNICSIPYGDRIYECQQCGTCSGSCPTSSRMDYSPRVYPFRTIWTLLAHLLRDGFADDGVLLTGVKA